MGDELAACAEVLGVEAGLTSRGEVEEHLDPDRRDQLPHTTAAAAASRVLAGEQHVSTVGAEARN